MATTVAREANQSDSRYLSSAQEIESCFKNFRDERVPLTLTLDGSEQQLTVKVLDVTSRGFLIEDVKPRDALNTLRARPDFSISVRAEGFFAFVEQSTISGEGEERGLPYFHVPFPANMLFQQRRKAARLKLPLRVSSAGAHITLFGREDLLGRIIDISAGGCRASFPAAAESVVQLGKVMPNCAIALPPRIELHSECTVRHCHTQRDGSVISGLEFTQMHVTDRRRLELFIQSLTRSKT